MSIKVGVFQQSKEAAKATGLTVVIDVFRAFTTACYFIDSGVEKLIPIADIEKARALIKKHPHYLLAGERKGKQLHDADFGNSPCKASALNLQGKTLVFTTSAGTQGFAAAVNANELISGSFCNAKAIVDYIKNGHYDEVSLVCMGHRNERPSDEDTLCAQHIINSLQGQPFSQEEIRWQLKQSADAKKFFDPSYDWALEKDFYACTELDKFDFILKYEMRDDLALLSPIRVN